jgi:thioredoxin reductase
VHFPKIAIIGGGPIGVETALYGACAGYDVQLFEKGTIAANVRRWGYVNFFTLWKKNRSPLAMRLLQEAGIKLHDANTTSNGDELAHYAESISELPLLQNRIHLHHEVLAISRESCLKSDFINDARRSEFPFRLLVRHGNEEKIIHADIVIDASGVYENPNPLGDGGIPCPGEIPSREKIIYHLPNVAGRDMQRFANKHTLIIGSGHSAASTLRSIGSLFEQFPQTEISWVIRREVPAHGAPYSIIPDDPSPHREQLHRDANRLAEHSKVHFYSATTVQQLEHQKYFSVLLKQQIPQAARSANAPYSNEHQITCDTLVAHTGFHADTRLWDQLQIPIHPAIGAPQRLAEELIRQNHRTGVGLSTGYAERKPPSEVPLDKWRFVQNDPQLLQSGEPGFYIIGIKSYGRDAGFLLQNGFRQIRDVFRLISDDAKLDLYDEKI